MFRGLVKRLLGLLPDSFIKLGLLALGYEFRNRASGSLGIHRAEIQYGPFKGGYARPSHWSGKQYWPVQVSGTYERKIVEFIAGLGYIDYAVDLGAAEGFYALNLKSLGLANRVVAFESNAEARQSLVEAANGLGGTEFTIETHADEISVLKRILASTGQKKLLISDIEGDEYALFTENLIRNLAGWHLVIELHDPAGEHDEVLVNRLLKTHHVNIVDGSEVSLSQISKVFPSLSQLELFNLAHEGRNWMQKWIIASPISVQL